MSAQHTPGPWAAAVVREYAAFAGNRTVTIESEPVNQFSPWAGRIDGVIMGYAGSEASCWEWLERFAYFRAQDAARAALAKATGVRS